MRLVRRSGQSFRHCRPGGQPLLPYYPSVLNLRPSTQTDRGGTRLYRNRTPGSRHDYGINMGILSRGGVGEPSLVTQTLTR